MRLEHAPPNEKLYANPLLGVQATGNSNAMRGAWKPLREAGATARTMLVAAAAKRWDVDAKSCRAQDGEVIHAPTGRRLTYGELAADAARMPIPASVALKAPARVQADRHAGQAARYAGKVNGTRSLWHRRAPARREDRDAGAIACVRRAREERGRHGGQGGQGRAPDRAARRCRCGRGRSYGRREERPGSARRSNGTTVRTPRLRRQTSRTSSSRRRLARARWRRTSATPTRPWRAPPLRSRRSIRFRSWRMPRWSR